MTQGGQPRPGSNSALKLRYVLRALPPAAPGLTQDWPHFTLPLPAAAVPFLMYFIVNFTITNLRYTEDMGNLGSEIFNATERHLQQLVRVPQQFSLPGKSATPCCLGHFSSASHTFTAGALIQEQHRYPLCWLQIDLAQVRPPLQYLQKIYIFPFLALYTLVNHSPFGLCGEAG